MTTHSYTWSQLSKAVGWEGNQIKTYPSMEFALKASDMQLFKWHRYLRSPETPQEKDILEVIITRCNEIPR